MHSTRIAFVEFTMVSFCYSVDMFRLAPVTFLLGLLRILDSICCYPQLFLEDSIDCEATSRTNAISNITSTSSLDLKTSHFV